MLINEAIRRHLIANAALVAVVGQRIYPNKLSQGVTYPAIAYRRAGKTTVEHLEEDNGGHAGLAQFRIRFFSTTTQANGGSDTAFEVDELLRLAMQGFRGTVTDLTASPVETLEINTILHQTTFDGYDDETQTYQVISDYDVWAEEATPP